MTDHSVFKDLCEMWFIIPIEEWRHRTWYGRLWYPLWLLISTCMWLVLTLILLLAIFINFVASVEGPPIYKDDN